MSFKCVTSKHENMKTETCKLYYRSLFRHDGSHKIRDKNNNTDNRALQY